MPTFSTWSHFLELLHSGTKRHSGTAKAGKGSQRTAVLAVATGEVLEAANMRLPALQERHAAHPAAVDALQTALHEAQSCVAAQPDPASARDAGRRRERVLDRTALADARRATAFLRRCAMGRTRQRFGSPHESPHERHLRARLAVVRASESRCCFPR